ncbi:MAG: V/A-type H+/Na+-transporting ATPase subunit [Methanofollis sp.]|nr:V/A-type H+/Na+-transporting ATPase subunit [Methanofollis sp.]
MGVEEIVERIRRDAAAEEERILREAAIGEERVLEDGRAASEREAAEIVAGGRREAEALRRRVLARARHSVRTHLRTCREAGISRAFEEAERCIADLRSSTRYPAILRRLIVEGREIVGGGPITVLCYEEDTKAVTVACNRIEGIEIASLDEDGGGRDGGVVVLAGRSRCDQRFFSRIARAREELTGKTAGILFGEDGHDHP